MPFFDHSGFSCFFMKTKFHIISFAAVPVALTAAFSAFAQTGTATELGETVVNATRFAEAGVSLPFGVSVITSEDLRKSGATTVNEAISKLLGVPARLDLFGGGNSTLDLRGFGTTASNNQVVVLDGLRLNEADGSGPGLSGIPVDSIERIEVIRGNGAVLYGEGATGGVIVITSKAGTGTKRVNTAQIYGAAGSYGLRDISGSATVAGGGFSVDIAANRREADGHRQNFQSTVKGVSLTGQWSNDWLRAGVRYGEDSVESGLPGGLTSAQYAANPEQASSLVNNGTIENERHGVFAEAIIGNWQLGADAGHRTKSYVSRRPTSATRYSVEAETLGLRAKHDSMNETLANSLVFGIDYNDWSRAYAGAAGAATTYSDSQSRAYYVKDDLTLLSTGTRLSVGLRTERVKKDQQPKVFKLDERQIAWDIGISQPFGKEVTFYSRYGRSFRIANADEFNATTPLIAIRPQTSKDFELGARWAYAKGKAEARLYRSDLVDEIGYDRTFPNPSQVSGFGANVNFDPTRRQGIEVELSHAVLPSVELRANAALRKAHFKSGPFSGKDVPLTPRQTLSLQAEWQIAEAHRLSGGVNWVAEQHPDFSNACTMPSYTTTNARYAYKYQKAEFSLGVNNLADRKFYSQAFSCTGGVIGSIYPEAGRAFTAAVRISF